VINVKNGASLHFRIAIDNRKKFGAEHRSGCITRQAARCEGRSIHMLLAQRRLILLAVDVLYLRLLKLLPTVSVILATYAVVFTISLLRPIAFGVIAAAGSAHLLTDGGAGRFTCSR